MLVLTRRPGEWVDIDLHEGAPKEMTLGDLFAQGPIRVFLSQINGDRARIGIQAPRELRILRSELGAPRPVRKR